MKTILVLILLALLAWGCPSKIVYGPDGVVTAENYTIKETVEKGKVINRAYVPNIPDRWYTGVVKQLTDGLGPFLEFFTGKPIGPVNPAPTPVPIPEPTPAPRPYP